MKVWNITCNCGFDTDFQKLSEAKREAKKHITHNEDKKVYIDQVETDPDPFEDYQTGKNVIVK